jgi:hypothetical protein
MEGAVTVLELPSLRKTALLDAQPAPGTAVRFGFDSNTLVDATWSGELRVRDLQTGQLRWSDTGDRIMQLAASAGRSTCAYDRNGDRSRVFVRR